MPLQIVLYEPQIPPNTGSIARLCAATTTKLNLIEPLGFSLDDRYLRRAGLDYWQHVDVAVWPNWKAFEDNHAGCRFILTSARTGVASHTFLYAQDDILVFGPEAMGLPAKLLDKYPLHVRIPIWGEVRSLNLANAAGIILYEAFRQTGVLEGK